MSTLQQILPGIPIVESPLFYGIIDKLDLSADERRVALELHERGYAVIDFPDPDLDGRIERIKASLGPKLVADVADPSIAKNSNQVYRIQDAWTQNDDVRAIAANVKVLALLSKLYGRNAFPFQTLNFPVGTQQALHSDSIHFSSVPERFMCGVWLAMEDIHPDAGPLTYLPGSHKWPILRNSMIGRRGWGSSRDSAQVPFQDAMDAVAAASGIAPDVFLARKGQALIWSANLLHGGSVQRNPEMTRWSQVTHYYFDDCIYYTPAFSDEELGNLDLRSIISISSGELKPNQYMGSSILPPEPKPTLKQRLGAFLRGTRNLPKDFSSLTYYLLNPDVATAGVEAKKHYLKIGRREGRRYKVAPFTGSQKPLDDANAVE